MSDNQIVPEAAVEAAARWMADRDGDIIDWTEYAIEARPILEVAAPHVLAGVTALADAWEARGERDMKVAKTIKDDYISSEILGHGAQMIENARHIRNALGIKP